MDGKNTGIRSLLPQYQVENFDPYEALVKLVDTDADGNETSYLYMEYAVARRWFLTVFPNGGFVIEESDVTNTRAFVNVRIYRDIHDERWASHGLGCCFYSDDPVGRNYVQNAYATACRNGLASLGFGTPPDAVETPNTVVRRKDDTYAERGDYGVAIPRPALPKQNTDPVSLGQPAKEEKAETVQNVSAPAEKTSDASNAPEDAPAAKKRGRKKRQPETVDASAANQTAVEQQPASPDMATESHEQQPQGAEPPKKVLTLDEAKKFVFPYGVCAGKTIEEAAAQKGNAFIRYHCDNAEGPLKEALTVYCEYNGC